MKRISKEVRKKKNSSGYGSADEGETANNDMEGNEAGNM